MSACRSYGGGVGTERPKGRKDSEGVGAAPAAGCRAAARGEAERPTRGPAGPPRQAARPGEPGRGRARSARCPFRTPRAKPFICRDFFASPAWVSPALCLRCACAVPALCLEQQDPLSRGSGSLRRATQRDRIEAARDWMGFAVASSSSKNPAGAPTRRVDGGAGWIEPGESDSLVVRRCTVSDARCPTR